VRARGAKDWGAFVAYVLCLLFALVGALPLLLGGVVRSSWAQAWAVSETERLLREQGMSATYGAVVRFWPPALELTNVRVASTDGGRPALASARVSVHPRFFALLSGRLAIDQIELDAPSIRLEWLEGKVKNLDLKLPESKGGAGWPLHVPFNVFTVAGADVDLTFDGVHAVASEIDLDVTVDDDPTEGSSFEIAVRAAESRITRSRAVPATDPSPRGLLAVDDDTLCSIDGRFRIEPHAVLVRRLMASGTADLDPASDTPASCRLPSLDKHRVELAVNHLRVEWPKSPRDGLRASGHVRARVPLGLAGRLLVLPQTDGWLGIDVDVRYAADTVLPDLEGHVEAHDVQLDRYRFAQEFHADVILRRDVLTIPRATLGIAEGVATFTDMTIEPLAKGVPMKTKLDVVHASFTTLMHDLGVSDHAHVAWDIREVHAPVLSGTLVPLHIDGDFVAQTGNFLVFDRAADDLARQRIIGIKDAGIHGRVAIRPYALEFAGIHLSLPHSVVDNGFCSIGFANEIQVGVPASKIDLVDLTPLATIPLAGQIDMRARLSGVFTAPHLDADATIQNFVFGDMPFGNVTAAHVSLNGLVVDLKDVLATKGRSIYEMPSARLDFGTGAPLLMDASVTSSNLGLRDFLGVLRMEDDPRFTEMDGTLATHSTIHLALGGPEDTCGAGYLDVRANTHAEHLKLFGESFNDGDVDLTYRSTDRLAGLAGADVDLRALTLHKVHARGKGPVLGVVLASGTIRRGGSLNASLVLQSLPLSSVENLGAVTSPLDGSASGLLQVGGTLEAYTVQGDIQVSPVRFRGASFGASHVHVGVTENAPAPRPSGRTRCGGAIFPPFDKAAYLASNASQGQYTFDGDLFDDEVLLEHVTMTRQKAIEVAGKIGLRGLPIGPLLAALRPGSEGDAPSPVRVEGEVTADIAIDHLNLSDLPHAVVSLSPTKLVASRGGQAMLLQTTGATITLANDTLTVPPLVFRLRSPGGLQGTCTVTGTVGTMSRDPDFALTADLAPIDLGVLAGAVPKIERSVGTLAGSLVAKGRLSSLDVAGKLEVRGGEFAVHGWPSDLSEVNVDVVIDGSEARIARGTAKFAGGTLNVTGSAPIKGSSLGTATAAVGAREIHVSPAPGISATLNADLELSVNSHATGADALPHVTGEVDVTSFEYTRPINLEASAFGGVTKRTNVEVYDPSLDALKMDILVKSRGPLRIRNNLIEIALGIESEAILVTGTDQRFGLRGELKALPGGRFHLRANDFDVRQGVIRFEDPTRIAPSVDVTAVTEYRRYTETSAGAAASAGTGTGGVWRITLHAYGDADHVRLDMTSDPSLSQEDIVLLLTIGMTRAEVDQLQAGSLGASAALEALATVSGADRAVKAAFPVIDDFRFGSAYSPQTGRTEPQVIVGKHLTDAVRASVATSVGEDEELRANIEWRLNQRLGIQAAYDNINDVSSSVVGNVGVDLRWHLEFE
jgi:translocation and assembly module TamB